MSELETASLENLGKLPGVVCILAVTSSPLTCQIVLLFSE